MLKGGFKVKHFMALTEAHQKELKGVWKERLLTSPLFLNEWVTRESILSLDSLLPFLESVFQGRPQQMFETRAFLSSNHKSPKKEIPRLKASQVMVADYQHKLKEYRQQKKSKERVSLTAPRRPTPKDSLFLRIMTDLKKNGLS